MAHIKTSLPCPLIMPRNDGAGRIDAGAGNDVIPIHPGYYLLADDIGGDVRDPSAPWPGVANDANWRVAA